jgi:hypothetical protein
MNAAAMSGVKTFLSKPISTNLPYLVSCPAFYKVAQREFGLADPPSVDNTTLSVFKWVYVRAFVVLGELSKYDPPVSTVMPLQQRVDEWRQVWLYLG